MIFFTVDFGTPDEVAKLTQRDLLLVARKERSIPHIFICFCLDSLFCFGEVPVKWGIYDIISLYIGFCTGG